MDRADQLAHVLVTLGVLGDCPRLPILVGGTRDMQGPTEPRDAVDLGVLGDEPEAGHRIVSLAK